MLITTPKTAEGLSRRSAWRMPKFSFLATKASFCTKYGLHGQCVPSHHSGLQVPQLLLLALRVLQGLSSQVYRFSSPPNPKHVAIKCASAAQQVHLANQSISNSLCCSIHFTFIVVAITAIQAVWPNHSVNRTYCGGPAFGL